MNFEPKVGEDLTIAGVVCQVAEHPSAPGMPYGQQGRMATVYMLTSNLGPRALKVFKPSYQRAPDQVILAQKLAAFAEIPGFSVCRRTVLTAPQHAGLLSRYPDLTGSLLMPWIAGPTWMLIVLQDRELTPEWSLYLARSLAQVLAAIEVRGAAHCDLSGPNILIPAFADGKETANSKPIALTAIAHPPLEVVDVEQMYTPGQTRPQTVPAGSAGYAHRTSSTGLWSQHGDRFAGALLIAEMLGWCQPQVRAEVWGEGFFDPKEMQDPGSARYRTLLGALRNRWGEPVADLFARAWLSNSLVECPRLSEWASALSGQTTTIAGSTLSYTAPATAPVPTAIAAPSFAVRNAAQPEPLEGANTAASALQGLARSMERKGKVTLALQYYRNALVLAIDGTDLHTQLEQKIKSLETGSQNHPSSSTFSAAGGQTVSSSSTQSEGSPPAGWIPVTVPPKAANPPVTTYAPASIAPPTVPPPKSKSGSSGAGSYNAGIKEVNYALPPNVTSLTPDPHNSSAPVPYVPTNTGTRPVYKVPGASSASGGRRQQSFATKVSWFLFILVIVAVVLGLLFWGTGRTSGSFNNSSYESSTPTPAYQFQVDTGATATAIAEDTAVALATREIVFQGNATAQALDSVAEAVYGPAAGTLQHGDGSYISTYSARVNLRNLVVESRFHNPYDADEHPWDYGFGFRDTGYKTYHLYLTDTGYWVLSMRDGTNWTDLQQGSIDMFDHSGTGSNTLKLLITDNRALFFVNNNYIATLDVSAHSVAGDVSVETGVTSGDQVNGKATQYEDFIVRRLPDPIADATSTAETQITIIAEAQATAAAQETATVLAQQSATAEAYAQAYALDDALNRQATWFNGPASGSLDPDHVYYAVNWPGTEQRNLIANVRFHNMSATSYWYYGIRFRETAGKVFEVGVNSQGEYHCVFFNGNNSIAINDWSKVPFLDTSAYSVNTLKVSVSGNDALFYINGAYVATLDVSSKTSAGTTAIVAFANDSAAIGFDDFTIWSLP